MRLLVVSTPRGEIPPERLPPLLDAMLEWYDRYQGKLDAFGSFIGGGGFGVVDVADENELHQMMLEMPFSPFSNTEIRPFVADAAGIHRAKEAFAAMAAAMS